MIRRNSLLFFLVGLAMLLMPLILFGLGRVGFALPFVSGEVLVSLGSIGAALLALSQWGRPVKAIITLVSALMVLAAQLYGLSLI